MSDLLTAVYAVAYGFVVVAVGRAAVLAWRHRDAPRINILLVLTSLAVRRLALMSVLLPALPYLLFRLVGHYRRVSPAWLGLSIGVIVLYVGSDFELAGSWSSHVAVTSRLLTACLLALVSASFSSEARRTTGVTRRRLLYAAVGAGAAAVAMAMAVGSPSFYNPAVGTTGVTFFCFFMAFTPPQFARRRWQQLEHARFLDETARLEPLERAAQAPAALLAGATRSVDPAGVFVALSDVPDGTPLTILAATDDELVGRPIEPASGLIARACRTGNVAAGRTDECEGGLADWCRDRGILVLAVPVRGGGRWGVVVVVQRVGSLFPDDDRALLSQFAQHVATILDHAHLLAIERERQRQAADRRVRDVEARLSLMLDSMKDYAMVILDADGRVATWHRGAAEIFGFSEEEMTDRPMAPLLALTSDELQDRLDQARLDGGTTWEGPCVKADDTHFVGMTTIQPLESEEDVPGFVLVTRDVSHERDLESQLRQSQKMEAIGQLAGGIAHDFNNLLLAIRGYADSLEEELRADPARQRQVGEIQRAAERAADLTRQLMAFGRRQRLQSSAVSLPSLVDGLVPMLERLIGEHIEIVHEADDEVPPVLGDRSQIEQVLLNLAVNARDAMPRGGRLTVRTRGVALDEDGAAGEVAPGDYVLLEVADTGTGMDADTTARIFEPFFTTKEVGRGTGLGLAVVYGIVRQLEGIIRVDSQPGRGTTFRVYLPKTDQPALATSISIPADAPRGTETILLVEDDVSVRTFLEDVLTRQGYRVLAADHADEAVSLARAHSDTIALVLTDVVLPGMNGVELVGLIEEICPGVPALYISGYADPAALAAQSPLATESFLQKPFSATDLLIRLRELLGPSR